MPDTNNSSSSIQEYDVLIVGAGPVGLATAIALRKRGIHNLLVIDQTREFRRVGQVVDILPNGLRSLKYIDEDAYQKVRETALNSFTPPQKSPVSHNSNNSDHQTSDQEVKALPKRQWHYRNLEGEITRSVDLDFESWFDRYGEGRVSISWFDLQTTLRNLLPFEIVQSNHRCINIEQDAELVSVDCILNATIANNPFAHWEMQASPLDASATNEDEPNLHRQLRAKLVIASDGINSTIRQNIYTTTDLQEWAKPKYSGFGAIACLQVENVPNGLMEELENKYWQGERLITLHNNSVGSSHQITSQDSAQLRLMLSRKSDHAVGYMLHAPLSLEMLQNKSPAETIIAGIKVLENAGFPPMFADLLSFSNPEKLIRRPYYIHPVNTPIAKQPVWSRGRVVLVGDAAHGMPPFMAQGANQGLEDAALISSLIAELIHDHCLDDQQAIAKAFRRYEEIRLPFMAKMQEATMQNNHWSKQEWDDYSEMVYSRTYSSNYLQ